MRRRGGSRAQLAWRARRVGLSGRVERIASPRRRTGRRGAGRLGCARARCRARRLRPRATAFLETELDVLLELAHLLLELPVFVLQLLDLSGHLPRLSFEPIE